MIGSIKKFFEAQYVPSEADFQNKGTLTPEQFVEAGDQLINFGWRWLASTNKPSKLLSNPQKQFLMSQAQSKHRIQDIIQQEIKQKDAENAEGFVQYEGKQQLQQHKQKYRHYTVYITYDEYYHTPRLWIKGTSIQGQPLTSKQIFEDIYAQYQNETVTEQSNPFLECRMLTIHPCKHSDVMKKFIDDSKSRNKKIKPYQCLIVFLKFMISVMPTIKYDHSIDLD